MDLCLAYALDCCSRGRLSKVGNRLSLVMHEDPLGQDHTACSRKVVMSVIALYSIVRIVCEHEGANVSGGGCI